MCANSGTLYIYIYIYTHDTHCMYLTWLRKRFALILQGEMERITSKCWSPAWRPGPLLEKVEIQLLNFKRIQGQGWRCQNRMIFIRVRIYLRARVFAVFIRLITVLFVCYRNYWESMPYHRHRRCYYGSHGVYHGQNTREAWSNFEDYGWLRFW